MTRMLTLAAVAAITLAPAVAGAQQTPRSRRPSTSVFSFSDNRGRIGVVVKTDADAQNDKIGARLEAVTPGGPADKAGLKAGDIITRFHGTALGGAAADDDEESGPGMKLVELARALDPGDSVRVEYRRGSDNRSATLVAEDLGTSWSFGGDLGRTFTIDPDIRLKLEDLPRMEYEFGPRGTMIWGVGRPWSGVELVSLNPDLGEYFGTREGVLVVKATGDSTLPLKGGDVILAIGGRKPTTPSHAMRILGSYDEGETVTIEVQRKRSRTTVTWTVPEARPRTRIAPRMREEPSALRRKIRPWTRVLPLKRWSVTARAI